MRVKLAFAAITVAALAMVACEPSSSEAPRNVPTPLSSACRQASNLDGYAYRGPDGSWVYVPEGTVLVEELRSDPGADVEAGCQALVDEYNANR
jgi:hypothetical protein